MASTERWGATFYSRIPRSTSAAAQSCRACKPCCGGAVLFLKLCELNVLGRHQMVFSLPRVSETNTGAKPIRPLQKFIAPAFRNVSLAFSNEFSNDSHPRECIPKTVISWHGGADKSTAKTHSKGKPADAQERMTPSTFCKIITMALQIGA